MDQRYTMIGFFVIVILYAAVGLLAAAGAISITRRFFGPRVEQGFYGVFLMMIAGFYLAFVAYFGNPEAWRVGTAPVGFFSFIGFFGGSLPVALVLADALHRGGDLLPRLQAAGGYCAFAARPL